MLIEEILKAKKEILKKKKVAMPLGKIKDYKRKKLSLKKNLEGKEVNIIAEIKRASPSAGIINSKLDIRDIAKRYEKLKVAGISVLTCEPYFKGCMEDLKAVRECVSIPVLMKDFIFDPYQIYEGNYYGADVVLLIMRILDDMNFIRLADISDQLGFEVIVEVHNKSELERAISLVKNWENKILGINNRNLETLEIDLNVTFDLIKFVDRDKITVISESGIKGREDILKMKNEGIKGFLIGESILKSESIENKLKELI